MPEGPSILITRDTIAPVFTGKKVTAVTGNAKIDIDRMVGKKLLSIKTWGKHLLLCFPGFTARIHFLLFGSYSMDTQTKADRSVRLMLAFGKRKIYFYTCAIKYLEGEPGEHYDWSADTLSDQWNHANARKKLLTMPRDMVCDVILNQDVFAGAGNIFKNEVLFRIRTHPESRVGKLPPRKLTELVKETHQYAFDFLEWKKAFVLKKHWQAHTKKICPRCDLPFIKKHCGNTNRRTFFCKNCQKKY